MRQVRAHERAPHVDTALSFVGILRPDHTVTIGVSVGDVRSNLEAKQQELADRLQAIHDACTHGYDIDAVLHPEQDTYWDRPGKAAPREASSGGQVSEE